MFQAIYSPTFAVPVFGAEIPVFGAEIPTFEESIPVFGAPTPTFVASPSQPSIFGGFGNFIKEPINELQPNIPKDAPETPLFATPTAPTSTSMFGATTPISSTLGGLRQQPATQSQSTGTGKPKFQTTTESDNGTINHYHSITDMSFYYKKSFEELRLEDYLAGKKNASFLC